MTESYDLFMPQQSHKMGNHPQFTDEESSSKGSWFLFCCYD